MNIANTIVIGVNKAGSTSIYRYLSGHPDVSLSKKKETCFFLMSSPNETLDAYDYSKFWDSSEKKTCYFEATPGYFYGGKVLIDEIRRVCGSPKLILVLREPTARTISFYKFMKSQFYLDDGLSFNEYVRRCLSNEFKDKEVSGRLPYSAIERSCYDLFIDDWVNEFKDDLLITFFDELVTNPDGFLEKLCKHIGIGNPNYSCSNLPAENKTRSYDNKILHSIALKINNRLERFFMNFPLIKSLIMKIYLRINYSGNENEVPENEVDKLNDIFYSHNKILSKKLKHYYPDLVLPKWLEL